MSRHQGAGGLLMKNIMRLVVVGSVIAITINVLMVFG